MNIAYWILVLILIVLWAVDAYRAREIGIKETIIIILFAIVGAAVFGIPG